MGSLRSVVREMEKATVKPSTQGQIGYDNPRENIDPHIKTKTISTKQGLTNIAPIGSVMAWLKTFTGVPSLPDNWAECDGSVINDSASPMNGQTLPDMNGENRVLLGHSASGTKGGSLTHSHGIGSYVAANESAHTHNPGTLATDTVTNHQHGPGDLGTNGEASHTHGVGTLANANESSHTHTYSHTTGGPSATTPLTNMIGPSSRSSTTHTHDASGTTDAGSAHTHTISGSTAAGSSHTHGVTTGNTGLSGTHFHDVDSGSTAAGSAHTHTLSGTSDTASSLPLYYTVVWIMRIK